MPRRDYRIPVWQKQLWREGLLHELKSKIDKKFLTVIQAPTGYGKTILLANFAQWITMPVCHVQVTGAERDPLEFLKLIAESLSNTFVSVDARLIQTLHSGNIATGIAAIRAAAEQLPQHLVIIDDLDKIEGAGVGRAIDSLLSTPWPTTKFIISVRYSLTLGAVVENLSNDLLGAMDKESLAFTAREAQTLLLKRGYTISCDEAEQMVHLADGAIAKILTIAPTWRQVNHGGDYTAMVRRILAEMDDDVVQFIRQTAILPYLNVELCNNLLDRSDSDGYLTLLYEKDLVQPLDMHRFQYSELTAISAKVDLPVHQRLKLYRKAVSLLLERKDYFHAGNLCSEIQDWSYLLDIIVKHGKELYHQGQVKLLEGWFIELPEWLLEQHVEVMLLYGRILVNDLSNPVYAFELFSRVEMIFDKAHNMTGRARAWAWQSVALREMGEPEQSLRLAIKSVAELREWGDTDLIAWSVRLLGLAHRAAGNLQEHLKLLREALRLYESLNDVWYIAQCHHDLGVGHAGLGDIEMAERHYQEAISIWEKMGIANYLANTINSVGVNRLMTDQPRQALDEFERSLVISEQSGSVRRQAFALANRGNAYLAMGQEGLAIDQYAASTRLAERSQARVLVLYNKIRTAECLYLSGMIEQSLRIVEECIRTAEEKRFVYELGLACELKGKLFLVQSDYVGALPLFEQAAGWLQSCFPFGVVRNKLRAAYSALRNMSQVAALNHLTAAIHQAKSLAALLPAWRGEMEQIEDMLAHFYISPLSGDEIREGIIFLLGREPKSTPVHLYLFGEPFLSQLGMTRQFYDRGKAAKGVEILALLALAGPSSKETIQETLWPESTLKESHPWFHWALRHMRYNLFEDIVVQTDQYYHIDFQWVDVIAFETLSRRIEQGEGLETRLELIDLYRGPFLNGFDLSEWGMAYRENITRQLLHQVRLAARELLDLKRPEQALNVLLRGLQEDAYQEDLYVMVGEVYEQLKLDPTSYLNWAAEVIHSEVGVEPQFSRFR